MDKIMMVSPEEMRQIVEDSNRERAEKQYWDQFRNETAAKVLAGLAALPVTMKGSDAADISVAWADHLITALKKPR